MERRRVLMLAGGLGAIVVLALVFLVFLRPSPEEVQMLPAPTHAAPAESTEQGVEVEPPTTGERSAKVVGTSARDPFDPVVKPSATADSSTDDDTTAKSSSDPVKRQKSATKPTGEQSGDAEKRNPKSAEPTEESAKGEGGGKAPVPIGEGRPAADDGPIEQTELTVVEVRPAQAVVRINGARMTLYLSVPDATGLTYVSDLGGGCGWFTVAQAEERLSICEGQSRAL